MIQKLWWIILSYIPFLVGHLRVVTVVSFDVGWVVFAGQHTDEPLVSGAVELRNGTVP